MHCSLCYDITDQRSTSCGTTEQCILFYDFVEQYSLLVQHNWCSHGAVQSALCAPVNHSVCLRYVTEPKFSQVPGLRRGTGFLLSHHSALLELFSLFCNITVLVYLYHVYEAYFAPSLSHRASFVTPQCRKAPFMTSQNRIRTIKEL